MEWATRGRPEYAPGMAKPSKNRKDTKPSPSSKGGKAGGKAVGTSVGKAGPKRAAPKAAPKVAPKVAAKAGAGAGKARPVSALRATPTNAGAKPEMKAETKAIATAAPNGARVEPAKATIATPAAVSNGTADRAASATVSATGAMSGGPAGDAGAVSSTAPDVSFREFQQLIRDRYYATDAARGVPGTFMWLIEEVGELATSLQDNAPGQSPTAQERSNLVEEFADVIAWLTTLANIAKVDLAEALTKYTDLSRVKGVKN